MAESISQGVNTRPNRMQEVEVRVETEKAPIPWKVTRVIFVVVLSTTYVTAINCYMSNPFEVFISILSGVFSFLALIGKNTKYKLIYGSAISGLVYLMPYGVFKAVMVGGTTAYLQTVAEMYVSHLCLSAYRSDAISFMNIIFTMQSSVIYFTFVFFPVKSVINTFLFMLVLVCTQAVCVFYIAPTPPVELVSMKDTSDSVIYGEVYKRLLKILDDVPFTHFHTEYREIVDIKNGKTYPLKERLWVILEKVNLSFMTTALLGVLSIQDSNLAPYLVIFTSTTMFSWIYAHTSRKYNFEMCILTLGFVLCTIITTRNIDPYFVFVIACSICLVPSEESFLSQTASTIAYANSLRAILGAALFFVLEKRVIDSE